MTVTVPSTMKAVVCHGPEDYRHEEVPVPTPGAGEALVQVEAVGICASDLKCYHGAAKFWGDDTRPAYVETPVIPGHEFVGRIVALDDAARKRWGVEVGDRVTSEQIVPCWECRYCRRGEYWMCQSNDVYGFHHRSSGAMAQYMVFPADALVHRVPDSLDPAHAAFVEPLSCALHGVERGDIRFGDVVVVAGAGPIGLGMTAGAAAKSPAAVVVLDQSAERLELARGCGATHTVDISQQDPAEVIGELTDGYGADVYLEASGHPSAVQQGLNLLRKLGTYVEYSVFGAPATVDWTIIGDDKELNIHGAHLGPHCWPAALDMLASGRLPMDRICTHQLPLADFQLGLDLVSSGTESVKVTLLPNDERTTR
ncbi:MAG TPA: alcohol dehydrogenase catalytic domain-containing protein [Candidatus Avipropionibacterium avicola]|uniref:Alcohol dehydrogenase catalytic domain-containing protein n=1 Tax=Candidatus Avipropionibacterium avicola TaxID=2840701 RepID=A0A9D1KMT3_9ACTN|nr:alcohol dehydrogenase catalytic domain-containing protein [Candidatus Avipropionibacterium avicola]